MPRFNKQPPQLTWTKQPLRILKHSINRPTKKTNLIWGNYGIQSMGKGTISMTQMDAFDLLIQQTLRRTEKTADQFVRLHFDWPATKKVKGHRMGGGRGKLEEFFAPVRIGDVIIEMRCNSALAVREAHNRIKSNLSFRTEIIEMPRRPEGVLWKRIPTRTDIRKLWRWTKGRELTPLQVPGKGSKGNAPKKK